MKPFVSSENLKLPGIFIALVVGLMFFSSFDDNQKSSKWPVPERANQLVNPVKNDPFAAIQGKVEYLHKCAICHGKKGRGDGSAGLTLKTIPTNFTWKKFQSQTDGAIYYKISVGKAPMLPYTKTLTDIQRWQIVNYLRTFKKS